MIFLVYFYYYSLFIIRPIIIIINNIMDCLLIVSAIYIYIYVLYRNNNIKYLHSKVRR